MTLYSGRIIDTHMHLWDISQGYTWLPQIADGKLNHNFLPPDYLKLCRNQMISHMVCIECGGFPHNRVLETEWLQAQADSYGFPHGIVSFAKLDAPDVENVIKAHTAYPNVRGIRMPLNFVAGCFGADRNDYMQDREWQKGFSLLAKHNLLFEMQIFDTQIPDAAKLARLFPDTTIILEHLGWPLKPDMDHLPSWKNRLAELAACSNVFLKLSCLGWVFQKYDEATTLPYLREGVALFGTDRCLVGSNCPPDTVYLSFDEIFHLLRKACSSYPEVEQEKIFYGNAKTVYRL